MPFLAFLDNMDESGNAPIEAVLDDYIVFCWNRIDRGLLVDRAAYPYKAQTL